MINLTTLTNLQLAAIHSALTTAEEDGYHTDMGVEDEIRDLLDSIEQTAAERDFEIPELDPYQEPNFQFY